MSNAVEELVARSYEGMVAINRELRVGRGMDSPVDAASLVRPWWDDGSLIDMWSDADKIALAERMIALWSEYRDRAKGIRPADQVTT